MMWAMSTWSILDSLVLDAFSGNKNMQVEPPCCIFIPSEYMMREIITALAYMANVESKEMKLRFGL